MNEILQSISVFPAASPFNCVSKDDALRPDLAYMRIFDEPLIGVAAADDDYLAGLIENKEANISMRPPRAWLASAASVISVFLPFTEQVRKSNRSGGYPSDEWLHARIQGQTCLIQLAVSVRDALTAHGYDAVVPILDSRFFAVEKPTEHGGKSFTSNWSERHAAYAAGLGTFSLSKGLITEKGVAGRFCSIITSMHLNATKRIYSGLTDYCIFCGKCAANCPVSAIDRAEGKKHEPCAAFLDRVKAEASPYYGCGKCQTNVPCEYKKPTLK